MFTVSIKEYNLAETTTFKTLLKRRRFCLYFRLNKEIDGGAWCPLSQISKKTDEYLEVDFRGVRAVTYIETQGRFGNSRGREYAEKYVLEYWRQGLGTDWVRYKNRLGEHVSLISIQYYRLFSRLF